MADWSLQTFAPEETERFGRLLGETAEVPGLILLRGDLGAGKTCLTRGIARGLGVPDDEPVTSPTYTLMQHYRGRCDLWHFDLYRLHGDEAAEEIGFFEQLQQPGLVVAEWPERLDSLFPEALTVEIVVLDEESRKLRCTAQSGAGVCWIARLEALWPCGCAAAPAASQPPEKSF